MSLDDFDVIPDEKKPLEDPMENVDWDDEGDEDDE
ncbi:hypothetical protein LCGC14_1503620 [marine sediment metagenome]|uniref:Uncharacterized protein n=1 Tax=marine sediment metagenome TaxID=412755 RepID=A0A0F9J3F2_9ZZZZ